MIPFWVRMYALLMCVCGVVFVLVDGWLFHAGAITRRLTMRACLMMGLLWPVFIFLLGYLLWRTWQRRNP